MQLHPEKINKNGKLKHLLAEDMYSEEITQVFDAKTGRYIGYIKNGVQVITDEPPAEDQTQEINTNPQQLKLF